MGRLTEEQASELLPDTYPWAEWSDGEWHLVDAKDFGVKPHAIRCAVYRYAEKHGLHPETHKPKKGRGRDRKILVRLSAM